MELRFDEFLLPLLQNEGIPSVELVHWRQVVDGTMEPVVIVGLDKGRHHPPGFFDRTGGLGPKALFFERLMPPFDLAVALRIEG